MKRTARTISTYSADVFGVASALFELGGMTVIHDASGCNSTFTTHDEPRWFDMESMVYISAVSELEAVLGDDEKLFGDIIAAANQLHPKFIAIAGTPIPTMTGFDFEGAAKTIEARTGIPTFGFPTTGMEDYSRGISMALEALAERFVEPAPKTAHKSCNILGLTPLDFSLNGMDQSIVDFMSTNGWQVLSTWAMGSTLEDMAKASSAWVNVVVSDAALAAAKVLQRRFGTPYVVGLPIGNAESRRLLDNLDRALAGEPQQDPAYAEGPDIALIGEGVRVRSLAACVHAETGRGITCICPLWATRRGEAPGEPELREVVAGCQVLIADPLYAPLAPRGCRFISLPHEAFSGRMFSKEFPDLVRSHSIVGEGLDHTPGH